MLYELWVVMLLYYMLDKVLFFNGYVFDSYFDISNEFALINIGS